MRYVLAADGGNSKTDLVLASTDGEVLARLTGTGTRPDVDGFDVTVDRLATLVRAAHDRSGVAPDAPVTAASFLLANIDSPEEETRLHAALTARRLAERIEVGNDTLAVLRAGASCGWGIALVCGAGINARGCHRDGRQERFLGIGSISGDWGGGEGIGVAGIAAAVRAGDGRGPATVLRDLVANHYGRDAESVAVTAKRGEIAEPAILAFAPIVFRAAADGDAVAVTLIERLADELVDYVRALVQRMSLSHDDVEVVLGGSALQSGNPVLMARLRSGVAHVAPHARLVVLDVPPLAGALVSALGLAGADADAVTRARAALRTPP